MMFEHEKNISTQKSSGGQSSRISCADGREKWTQRNRISPRQRKKATNTQKEGLMLPREKRVSASRDFKRVYQKGSFFSASLFNVNYLANRLSFARLGVVINKKVEPKATKRNKIKRRFREASKKIYQSLPDGYDYIFNIKAKSKEANFAEIEKELKIFVARLKK